jgi:uncharacterized membrane protein YraQ (UPF0718 family)
MNSVDNKIERDIAPAQEEQGLDITRVFNRVALALLAAMLLFWIATSAQVDFGSTLNTFSVRFLSVFIEAAPFLLLGTLLSGVIDTFVSPKHIARWVPHNTVLGVIVGAFAGFLLPVCECGVVPVVRQLYSKNLPVSVGIAFLLAAPVMNPIVFASTLTAFGWGPVLLGRYVISAAVAVSVGMLFSLVARRSEVLLVRPVTQGEARVETEEKVEGSVLSRLGHALVVAGDEFFEMGRYLIIGSLLAAGMQTLVPQDSLVAVGSGPVLSVLVMLALAFLLSVCSTVDAFIALAFKGTFTTGSILAFLTFGPMVDIKSTVMYLGVFTKRTVLFLTLLPLAMTMFIGLLLNLLKLS